METKFCPDCGCNIPITDFGKPRETKKKYKNKTYIYVVSPGYCKKHAYLRNKKSLNRNAEIIEKNKEYQKNYNKIWQKTNRKKQLQIIK